MYGRLSNSLNFSRGTLRSLAVRRAGRKRKLSVFGGAQFDLLGTGPFCGIDLIDVRIDKGAYKDPVGFQAFERSLDSLKVTGNIKAAFGRDLVLVLRYKRDGVGFSADRYCRHFVS